MAPPLRVGIVGCGLIGNKRAHALAGDKLVGCYDILPQAAKKLASETGTTCFDTLDELLHESPDVLIVATVHDVLADLAIACLGTGAHVLIEKPAGIASTEIERIRAAADAAGRLAKVGFNHRFHPGIARAFEEAKSGVHGQAMFMRCRYGHGGRPGYENEWRLDRARSGGGELVDQGMHVLDLSYWLFGELPIHGSLLRTHYWGHSVEDNAVVVLGENGGVGDSAPWAMLHVSWTEWKNTFSLEIFCERAKLQVEGLTGSYGQQQLYVYRMRPELGPPDTEVVTYPARDLSWEREWAHFSQAISAGDGRPLLGDLSSASYAWKCVEEVLQR